MCQERSLGFSPLILILGETKKQKPPNFQTMLKINLAENVRVCPRTTLSIFPVKNQIKYPNELHVHVGEQLTEIKFDESSGATASPLQGK